MVTALFLGCGLFWTTAYVLIIRVGLRDRSYGMPIVALAANLAWEFIFSFVRPSAGVQQTVNIVWFLLDLGILATVVRFWPREFPWLSRRTFLAGLAATIALAYLGVNAVSLQFDHGQGFFAAFGQDLMMSGLFLGMLTARRSLRGQSVAIAVCKLIGSALAAAGTWLHERNVPLYHGDLLPYLYFATLLVNAAYVLALLAVKRAQPATPTRATAPAAEQIPAGAPGSEVVGSSR